MPKRNTYHSRGDFFRAKQEESETPEEHWRKVVSEAVLFFWKWKHNLSPAFSRLQIATANLKTHDRTLNSTFHSFANSEQLKNSLFKRVVPFWRKVISLEKNCEFKDIKKEDLLISTFINSVIDKKYTEKLIGEKTLNFKTTMDLVTQHYDANRGKTVTATNLL